MEFNEISLQDINQYLEKTRKRGARTLSILGQISPQINAVFGTEIGREILKDDMARVDFLLNKTYQDGISEDERIELKYLKNRIDYLLDKLHQYLKLTGEIRDATKSR